MHATSPPSSVASVAPAAAAAGAVTPPKRKAFPSATTLESAGKKPRASPPSTVAPASAASALHTRAFVAAESTPTAAESSAAPAASSPSAPSATPSPPSPPPLRVLSSPYCVVDMSSAPLSQAEPVLQLTDLEQRIFALVLGAVDAFKLDTQVRVAGGWVRDKLLGLESADIDFALDNLSGEEFAGKLAEHMAALGLKASSIGVIKSNPDQSKHLATATMKVLDMSIDMNNFRSEVYEPSSRIPTITLSTAREDALRRDFTVNALFYNIHTKKVEDYVDGLKDLRAGVLRTPRDPMKTFSDDPLRILRAARFAGRFGFTVHKSIATAARTPSVQADLASKVSRERMGIEVGKMLTLYKTASSSFGMLCDWGLRRVIFEVAPNFEPTPVAELGVIQLHPIEPREAAHEDPNITALCLQGMRQADEMLQQGAPLPPDHASILLLASFLAPYYGYRVPLKGGKSIPLVHHIVRESLRLTLREATLASNLLSQSHQLIRASVILLPGVLWCKDDLNERLLLTTGALLRQTGAHWPVACALGHILLRTFPKHNLDKLSPECIFDRTMLLRSEDIDTGSHASYTGEQFLRYWDYIRENTEMLALPVWEMKPLASGTEVCEALGLNAKGPVVGQVVNKMMEWQIIHLRDMKALKAPPAVATDDTSSSSAAAAASSATAAAASSSSPAPAAASAVTANLTASSSSSTPPDPATLDEVRARCFQWLSQFKDSFAVAAPSGSRTKGGNSSGGGHPGSK